MSEDDLVAESFAAGMAVVALEDAFLDLVELLLRDGALRRVEVEALRHLHVERFDAVQRAGKMPVSFAQAIEGRRERLEISWERKLGKA